MLKRPFLKRATRVSLRNANRSQLILALSLAAGTQVALYLNFSNRWRATHWLFTYDHEFIKRGLVGTLTSTLFGDEAATEGFILHCSLVLLVAVSASMLWLISTALKDEEPLCAAPVAMALVVCPATLSAFAFDLGSFDQIGLVIVVGSLSLLLSRFRALPIYLMISALGVIGTLIHEAFVALHLPVIASATLLDVRCRAPSASTQNPIAKLLAIFSPALAAFAVVALLGRLESHDLPTHIALLSRRSDFIVDANSVSVLYTTAAENAAMSIGTLGLEAGRYAIGTSLAAVIPTVALALTLWAELLRRRAYRVATPSLIVVGLSSLGPLPLFVLGVDFPRWIGWITVHTLLTWVWACARVRLPNDTFIARRTAVLAVATTAYSAAVGPLRIIHGPERIDSFLAFVRSMG